MNRPEQGERKRNNRGGRGRRPGNDRRRDRSSGGNDAQGNRGSQPQGGGRPQGQRNAGKSSEPARKAAPNFDTPMAKDNPTLRYGVVFYDNHSQAKADFARLEELAQQYDRLNIVIRAEGEMDDPDLTQYGKVFAGAAWALIHDRRVAEGWYDQLHI